MPEGAVCRGRLRVGLWGRRQPRTFLRRAQHPASRRAPCHVLRDSQDLLLARGLPALPPPEAQADNNPWGGDWPALSLGSVFGEMSFSLFIQRSEICWRRQIQPILAPGKEMAAKTPGSCPCLLGLPKRTLPRKGLPLHARLLLLSQGCQLCSLPNTAVSADYLTPGSSLPAGSLVRGPEFCAPQAGYPPERGP